MRTDGRPGIFLNCMNVFYYNLFLKKIISTQTVDVLLFLLNLSYTKLHM